MMKAVTRGKEGERSKKMEREMKEGIKGNEGRK